jgi:hypothetical protein
VIRIPAGFECQPVDSDEVAARLVELTLGAPVLIPGTRAIRAGALLPPPGHSAGNRTWEQLLAANRTATSVRLFDHLVDGRCLQIGQLNRRGRDVLADVIR